MTQKYIVGDIVEYDNKVMVVKEPRDGTLSFITNRYYPNVY